MFYACKDYNSCSRQALEEFLESKMTVHTKVDNMELSKHYNVY